MDGSELIANGMTALQNGQALPKLPAHADPAKARKAAQDFEGVFIGQMLQPLFSGLDASPPFGGGSAEKMWRSLMVDEIGKSIAKHGGIGLADQVQAELIRTQESH